MTDRNRQQVKSTRSIYYPDSLPGGNDEPAYVPISDGKVAVAEYIEPPDSEKHCKRHHYRRGGFSCGFLSKPRGPSDDSPPTSPKRFRTHPRTLAPAGAPASEKPAPSWAAPEHIHTLPPLLQSPEPDLERALSKRPRRHSFSGFLSSLSKSGRKPAGSISWDPKTPKPPDDVTSPQARHRFSFRRSPRQSQPTSPADLETLSPRAKEFRGTLKLRSPSSRLASETLNPPGGASFESPRSVVSLPPSPPSLPSPNVLSSARGSSTGARLAGDVEQPATRGSIVRALSMESPPEELLPWFDLKSGLVVEVPSPSASNNIEEPQENEPGSDQVVESFPTDSGEEPRLLTPSSTPAVESSNQKTTEEAQWNAPGSGQAVGTTPLTEAKSGEEPGLVAPSIIPAVDSIPPSSGDKAQWNAPIRSRAVESGTQSAPNSPPSVKEGRSVDPSSRSALEGLLLKTTSSAKKMGDSLSGGGVVRGAREGSGSDGTPEGGRHSGRFPAGRMIVEWSVNGPEKSVEPTDIGATNGSTVAGNPEEDTWPVEGGRGGATWKQEGERTAPEGLKEDGPSGENLLARDEEVSKETVPLQADLRREEGTEGPAELSEERGAPCLQLAGAEVKEKHFMVKDNAGKEGTAEVDGACDHSQAGSATEGGTISTQEHLGTGEGEELGRASDKDVAGVETEGATVIAQGGPLKETLSSLGKDPSFDMGNFKRAVFQLFSSPDESPVPEPDPDVRVHDDYLQSASSSDQEKELVKEPIQEGVKDPVADGVNEPPGEGFTIPTSERVNGVTQIGFNGPTQEGVNRPTQGRRIGAGIEKQVAFFETEAFKQEGESLFGQQDGSKKSGRPKGEKAWEAGFEKEFEETKPEEFEEMEREGWVGSVTNWKEGSARKEGGLMEDAKGLAETEGTERREGADEAEGMERAEGMEGTERREGAELAERTEGAEGTERTAELEGTGRIEEANRTEEAEDAEEMGDMNPTPVGSAPEDERPLDPEANLESAPPELVSSEVLGHGLVTIPEREVVSCLEEDSALFVEGAGVQESGGDIENQRIVGEDNSKLQLVHEEAQNEFGEGGRNPEDGRVFEEWKGLDEGKSLGEVRRGLEKDGEGLEAGQGLERDGEGSEEDGKDSDGGLEATREAGLAKAVSELSLGKLDAEQKEVVSEFLLQISEIVPSAATWSEVLNDGLGGSDASRKERRDSGEERCSAADEKEGAKGDAKAAARDGAKAEGNAAEREGTKGEENVAETEGRKEEQNAAEKEGAKGEENAENRIGAKEEVDEVEREGANGEDTAEEREIMQDEGIDEKGSAETRGEENQSAEGEGGAEEEGIAEGEEDDEFAEKEEGEGEEENLRDKRSAEKKGKEKDLETSEEKGSLEEEGGIENGAKGGGTEEEYPEEMSNAAEEYAKAKGAASEEAAAQEDETVEEGGTVGNGTELASEHGVAGMAVTTEEDRTTPSGNAKEDGVAEGNGTGEQDGTMEKDGTAEEDGIGERREVGEVDGIADRNGTAKEDGRPEEDGKEVTEEEIAGMGEVREVDEDTVKGGTTEGSVVKADRSAKEAGTAQSGTAAEDGMAEEDRTAEESLPVSTPQASEPVSEEQGHVEHAIEGHVSRSQEARIEEAGEGSVESTAATSVQARRARDVTEVEDDAASDSMQAVLRQADVRKDEKLSKGHIKDAGASLLSVPSPGREASHQVQAGKPPPHPVIQLAEVSGILAKAAVKTGVGLSYIMMQQCGLLVRIAFVRALDEAKGVVVSYL